MPGGVGLRPKGVFSSNLWVKATLARPREGRNYLFQGLSPTRGSPRKRSVLSYHNFDAQCLGTHRVKQAD